MPRVRCVKSIAVQRTGRVRQLEGLFDLAPVEHAERVWEVELPLEQREWRIGLIAGPSGCGKSTLARELFPKAFCEGFDWPTDRAVVDGFPATLGIRRVTELLSSVGFSSPPGWLKPFRVLSHGEQFRVTMARALAEPGELAVIDEFTSVVDRTVARIGSAAIARTLRRAPDQGGEPGAGPPKRFVAVSCHEDIIDWLQPDWTYNPATDQFQWRSLRPRPPIELEIVRVPRNAWRLFMPHHYLSGHLHRSAQCFVARFEGRPAAFTAVLSHPDPLGGYWREHRSVCLPDFQGVGIGHALSEFVASLFAATGKRYLSVTSHPGMIRHRLRSPLWVMYRTPTLGRRNTGGEQSLNRTASLTRRTAGFRYVGPANEEAARRIGGIRLKAGD
ncbi:MAG: GNAT family N-acetyltransferase [Planctomycetales bacterium]